MNLPDEQKEELKCKTEGEKTLRRRRVIESISYRDEYSPFLSDSGDPTSQKINGLESSICLSDGLW